MSTAILFVSGELLVELCKSGPGRRLNVQRGLPRDAELVRIIPSPNDTFGMEIASAAFPLDGAEIDASTGLPIIPPPTFTVVT